MKKIISKSLIALALFAVSAPAFASELPALPNNQWYYEEGATTVGPEVTTVTESDVYNQAFLKSGGKASDKNKANFKDVTTTVSQTTTTEYDAYNPADRHVADHDATLTDTVIISEATEKEHVQLP